METDLAAPTKIGSTTSLGTHTIEVRLDKWRAHAGPDVPEGVARAPPNRWPCWSGKSPNWN